MRLGGGRMASSRSSSSVVSGTAMAMRPAHHQGPECACARARGAAVGHAGPRQQRAAGAGRCRRLARAGEARHPRAQARACASGGTARARTMCGGHACRSRIPHQRAPFTHAPSRTLRLSMARLLVSCTRPPHMSRRCPRTCARERAARHSGVKKLHGARPLLPGAARSALPRVTVLRATRGPCCVPRRGSSHAHRHLQQALPARLQRRAQCRCHEHAQTHTHTYKPTRTHTHMRMRTRIRARTCSAAPSAAMSEPLYSTALALRLTGTARLCGRRCVSDRGTLWRTHFAHRHRA